MVDAPTGHLFTAPTGHYDGGAIAGSTLTLDRALKFAVHEAGFGVAEAYAALTTTPARMINLTDRGRLEVGQRADLCHVDDNLDLTGVWSAGAPVAR